MTVKRIKILHVVETVHSGGVEKRRLSLAKYLGKERYEQKLVCTNAKGPIVYDFEREGISPIPIGRFRWVFDIVRYWKLLKIIHNYRPDIIHGAVFEGNTMACVCGFLARVPVVIAEDTSGPEKRTRRANWLLRTLFLAADKVVAISPTNAQYFQQRLKIKSSKIQLINNGVEVPREVDLAEASELKRKLGITDNDFVIGSVGRLRDNHKRFTDIIRAVSRLKDHSHTKILLVGEGQDRGLIEACAREHEITDRLIMAGYQTDTALYYRVMDLFCLVSATEGLPLVAAEAMLMRLPVVAASVGGLPYVVQDNESGFLVSPGNPELIAEKIDRLIRDPILRRSMGQKGCERAVREYTAEIYTAKVDEMYRELLSMSNGKYL